MTSLVFKLSLLRGDEGSSQDRDLEWLRVFRHFDPRLRDFFGRRGQALPVDEIVGEVWGRAFLFISTLKDAAALWSWLTTIGNNVIRDRIRSQGRHPSDSLSDSTYATAVEESFVRAWIDAENEAVVRVDVQSLISRLPPADRELLRLVAVDGLSHDEIATQLGLPSAGASRKRLQRIRVQLQEGRKSGRTGHGALTSKEVDE
jgi:RNA polymerase sigma-70 factor (ECF subfamily)